MSTSGSESGRSSASGTSGGASSIGSNQSDARALDALRDGGDDSQDIGDLLQQNRSVQDAVFATLFTLTKNRSAGSLRWTALVVVVTFLQIFRVIFNSTNGWNIDRDLWAFKAIYWLLYRTVVFREDYATYIAVLYILSSLVLFCLAVTGWVAVALKKDDSSGGWMQKLITALQWLACILFQYFWVANLDYLTFMFNCSWMSITTTGAMHNWYTHQSCLAMPHLAHMLFAGVMAVVFTAATICMALGECELNLMSRDYLSTTAAACHFKTLALKVVIVVLASLEGLGKAQGVIILICCALITWLMIMEVPYNDAAMNCVWGGLWMGITYTAILLVALVYTVEGRGTAAEQSLHASQMTWYVLYGIFPAVLLGAGITWLVIKYKRQPLKVLASAHAAETWGTDLKTVYRFKNKEQVLFLATVMRKWDLDGVPDPEASAFGTFILKCGLARFPNDSSLAVINAALLIEVQHDAQAARNQLQAASKNSPSFIDRYFIYAANQLVKKLKTDGDGMDLMGYVEFQRNYLACVRTHKLALAAQRRFWHTILKDTVQFSEVQKALDLLDRAEKQASQVYKRVLERYPNNGKLLKVYGRFLEFVRNDPWTANRYYQEALKAGTKENLLELAQGQTGNIMQLMGEINEKEDTIIIINAQGVIMMVNSSAATMFGYAKGELEGKNISCLMPQPFSGRHNGYLQRYTSTGEARILDSKRHVVGLHKDRSLFPLDLVVTKLSGTGADAVFLGICRVAADDDTQLVRVWVTPQGAILCCDMRFRDWFGVSGDSLVGKPCHSLGKEPEALSTLLLEAQEVVKARGDLGQCQLKTALMHAFLPPVDVSVSVELGGTDDNPIFVLNLRCMIDNVNLLVTSQKGAIVYATSPLAKMLGYPVKTLATMQVRNLMPQPYSDLHTGWLKTGQSAGQVGCMGGQVVDMVTANGSRVPVTLKFSVHTEGDHMKHVIQVARATEAARLDSKRLLLSLNASGTIVSIDSALSSNKLFGFNPQELQGRTLSSCVQQVGEWVAQGHGTEGDLLLLLLAACSGTGTSTQSSWRVGLHIPSQGQQAQNKAAVEAASGAGAAAFLSSLTQGNKQRPAVLRLRSLVGEEDDALALAAEGKPMIQVELWRADALNSVVELDSSMHITKADDAFCLMSGYSMNDVIRRSLPKLLSLPPDCNLAAGHGGAKKGLMKSGEAQVTPMQRYAGQHVDGSPMQISGQLVKPTGRKSHQALRLHMVAPAAGTLQPLLALKRGAGGERPAVRDMIRLDSKASSGRGSQGGPEEEEDEEDDGDGPSGGRSMEGSEAAMGEGAAHRRGAPQVRRGEEEEEDGDRPDSPDLHNQLKSRLRVSQWVNDSFNGHGHKGHGADPEEQEAGAHVVVALHKPGSHAAGKGKHAKEGSDEEEAEAPGRKQSDGGSVAEGSQSGDDAMSAITSSAGGDEGEELSADFRRAKRLKKLVRLLTGSAAQSTSVRFYQHTWVLVLLAIVAHIACFIALTLEINSRYENAYNVGLMAKTTDRFLRISLRNNILVKCSRPENARFPVCSEKSIQRYYGLYKTEIETGRTNHQGLLLGFQQLRTFRDPRLLDYWLRHNHTEIKFDRNTLEGPNQFSEDNRTLWDMGNRVVNYASDAYFMFPSLKENLNGTEAFQYVAKNAEGGMFAGYAWSLDTYVDFTWDELTKLSVILIVLLVVEAVVIQPLCIGYEFFLLKLSQQQHMKRFSAFLGLPSATLRIMATRQVQIDDDDKSEQDDEEVEMLAATGAGEASGKADEKQQQTAKKSVRMAEDVPDDEEEGERPSKGGKGRKGRKGRKKDGDEEEERQAAAAAAAAATSGWSAFAKKAQRTLFGWMTSRIKVNGRKLFSDNTSVLKFMVPLLLWLAAVVIIFGVSFQQLSGLQGPLASLDNAAHVMYRSARVRAYANQYAMADAPSDIERYRGLLAAEVEVLAEEYNTLMYGGLMKTMAPVHFDRNVPPAAFASKRFSDLFFTTKQCLRQDLSTCFTSDNPYYVITHQGLDAMITRFIDEMGSFVKAPESMVTPNHTGFLYIFNVVANDMTAGLDTAIGMFEEYTISQFARVKDIHIILLVVTLVGLVAFVFMVFRPYVAKMRSESKVFAGLLSHLPGEVDAEGQVRLAVFGIKKEDGKAAGIAGAPPMGLLPGIPGMPGMGMAPGMMPFGAPGMPMAQGMMPLGGPMAPYSNQRGAPGGYARWNGPGGSFPNGA